MDNVIIELATFKVAGGASKREVREAVLKADSFLEAQEGYLDRELCHDPSSGEWVQLLRWASLEDARGAERPFFTSPHTQPMLALLDPDSTRSTLFEVVIPRNGA